MLRGKEWLERQTGSHVMGDFGQLNIYFINCFSTFLIFYVIMQNSSISISLEKVPTPTVH